MFGGEYIFLLRQSNMCINFCYCYGAMTKHFLDIPNIDIGFQQACCEGMSKHMWGYMQVDGSKRAVFVNHSSDRLIRHRTGIGTHKKIAALINL